MRFEKQAPRATDVLVIGGGPAGLAAAIAAREAGLEVILADHSLPPIDKACGEGLMPDGIAALRRLGITLSSTSAIPFAGIRFLDESSHAAAEFSSGFGYGIRRIALHQLLVSRAEKLGVVLHWGRKVKVLSETSALLDGYTIRHRWLIGADGQNSALRRATELEAGARVAGRRFGLRRHYRITPWTQHVEVYWADCGQMYITPVAEDEVCAAFITGQLGLPFDQALARFPVLTERLHGAAPSDRVIGSVTCTRRLASVHRGAAALVGEASGSVDAITGEGMSLAFRQACALAESLRRGNLDAYEEEHRRIMRRPRLMSALMMQMGSHPQLRRRVLHALAAEPRLFAPMLDIHTGARSPFGFGVANALSLGWRLVSA